MKTPKAIKLKGYLILTNNKPNYLGIVRDIDYCDCGNPNSLYDSYFITKDKKEAELATTYNKKNSFIEVLITPITTHKKKKYGR